MKLLFLIKIFCACYFFSSAQLSRSDTINDHQMPATGKLVNGLWKSRYLNGQLLDSGSIQNGIPDGKWMGWYKNGTLQFVRTYSFDKWVQFQNEKTRYHPKRISMPITKLYHENKMQAEKYTTAINSFCSKPNCLRGGENVRQIIDNNATREHYHPVFENGLLDGVFVNYFPDGAVKDSGNYNDGLPEGLWIKWTDDKQFYWQGFFKHGIRDKEWKLYSPGQKLIRIIFYNNGKYTGRKDIVEGVETVE